MFVRPGPHLIVCTATVRATNVQKTTHSMVTLLYKMSTVLYRHFHIARFHHGPKDGPGPGPRERSCPFTYSSWLALVPTQIWPVKRVYSTTALPLCTFLSTYSRAFSRYSTIDTAGVRTGGKKQRRGEVKVDGGSTLMFCSFRSLGTGVPGVHASDCMFVVVVRSTVHTYVRWTLAPWIG